MRVALLLAPGAQSETVTRLRDAVRSFNRGLDIRLRFLSIGIDLHELSMDDPAEASQGVDELLLQFDPEAAVLIGDGETAVAAAAAVVRQHRTLVRLGAGRRAGANADAARAVDRLATWRLVDSDEPAAALAREGLTAQCIRVGDPASDEFGRSIIGALRTVRQRAPGDGTC